MLVKKPKPLYRKLLIKGAAIVFVAEVVAFAGSYFIWNRLNTDRDFRRSIQKDYPLVLETYYKIGETFGSSNIRQIDNEYWKHQDTVE